jgi:O-antigen/teichoic acid export membrane protein
MQVLMKEHSGREKLLNISIRAITLGCRFLFIFFLAKLLSPSEVGLYGLVTATVAYSLYFVGLDFYTYTTRELASHSRSAWGGLLKNQIALSLVLYAVVLPGLLFVFVSGMLPWELAKWFFLLIILEHICQELIRLFVAVSEQLAASVVLLLRQGTWAVVIVVLMVFEEGFRNLNAVFGAWSAACILAILFSIRKLRTMEVSGWRAKIDREWIWRGLKVALPFLVATLAIRGVFTVDRYWIQLLAGLEVVGAYVLFIGVANTLMAFLDAGVFSFAYPGMIAAYQSNDPTQYRRRMREMLALTLVFSALFAGVSAALFPYLLDWLGKDVYLQNYSLFYWLLLATILNALGMIPHYAIYAQKRDRPIIQSHLAALPIFAVVTAVASVWVPLFAVPLGLCASQLFIIAWKLRAYLQCTPEPFLGIARG